MRMYEAQILEQFKGMPVFRLADASQVIRSREYAKKFLARMIKEKKIQKIRRDFYTLHSDPFLASTFAVKPSYITSVSALYFHRLITQIPKDVFCCTERQSASIKFISEIKYKHTGYFFGFTMHKYEGFSVPVAVPEKAVIDSIGIVPLSLVEEALDSIDAKELVRMLCVIKKSSFVKRIGFLAERNGLEVYKKLEKFISKKYINLDPLAKNSGKKDAKWKVIING